MFNILNFDESIFFFKTDNIIFIWSKNVTSKTWRNNNNELLRLFNNARNIHIFMN